MVHSKHPQIQQTTTLVLLRGVWIEHGQAALQIGPNSTLRIIGEASLIQRATVTRLPPAQAMTIPTPICIGADGQLQR